VLRQRLEPCCKPDLHTASSQGDESQHLLLIQEQPLALRIRQDLLPARYTPGLTAMRYNMPQL